MITVELHADDIQALCDLMWQRLLFVGRRGLTAFAIGSARAAEGFMERGFPGVKVKVGRPDAPEDEERVGAVRRLIGDDVDLMIDANMSWSVDEALERGRRLEEFGLYWYEEPTIPEDVAGHARLVRELDVPIAIGESLHSPHEYRSYVNEQAVEVVQIGPITNGGITVSLEALELANAAGLPTSSHYTDELSAHLLCASARPPGAAPRRLTGDHAFDV